MPKDGVRNWDEEVVEACGRPRMPLDLNTLAC